MALIVEDGSGKPDAESYVLTADVDTYAARFGLTFSGTTTEKEIACRTATQYLDTVYEGRWLGQRKSDTQALDWPRLGIVDRDGYLISASAIVQDLKDATCELAIRARAETLLPDLTSPGTIASESVRLGPLEKSTSYVGGKSQVKGYRKVDLLLGRWVLSGAEVTRA